MKTSDKFSGNRYCKTGETVARLEKKKFYFFDLIFGRSRLFRPLSGCLQNAQNLHFGATDTVGDDERCDHELSRAFHPAKAAHLREDFQNVNSRKYPIDDL
ncbi:MAG TPA: hypothetical protein VJ756_06495, partial [Terriglobales bacterium]|nr:hypothetical protein [Terriglobales bacterium]